MRSQVIGKVVWYFERNGSYRAFLCFLNQNQFILGRNEFVEWWKHNKKFVKITIANVCDGLEKILKNGFCLSTYRHVASHSQT